MIKLRRWQETMAEITVKLFGVFRSDTHMAKQTVNAGTLLDIFPILNDEVEKNIEKKQAEDPSIEKPEPIKFKDAVVYVNGERISKKGYKLKDGDEVWLMSPASGG